MQREKIIEPESTRTAVERKGMGSSLCLWRMGWAEVILRYVT